MARKPTSITYEQAAAVPAAGSTAWQALVDAAKLSAGQTVLIHGGSGGVGHMAIQIAKARGARVIATASTANQDFLKKLGADQAIDYTKTKFEDVVKDVDVVLDAVGGDTLTRSYGVVKKGGDHRHDRGRAGSGGARRARHSRRLHFVRAEKRHLRRTDALDRSQETDAGRDARCFRSQKWPKPKTKSRHGTPRGKDRAACRAGSQILMINEPNDQLHCCSYRLGPWRVSRSHHLRPNQRFALALSAFPLMEHRES